MRIIDCNALIGKHLNTVMRVAYEQREKTLHIAIPLHRKKRKMKVLIVGVRVIPTGYKNFQGPPTLSTKTTTHHHKSASSKSRFDIVIDKMMIKLLPPNGVEPVTSALLVPRSTN